MKFAIDTPEKLGMLVRTSRKALDMRQDDAAWAHSVINEWFVMTLAKRLGLNVPPVTSLYVPQPVYLVERFDRLPEQPDWRRLHCIDACQLTGLSREFKYSTGAQPALACA